MSEGQNSLWFPLGLAVLPIRHPPSNSPEMTQEPKPKVITWFKVYASFLCFLYLAVAAGSLYLFRAEPSQLQMSATEARIMGVIFLAMGLALFAACLVPLVLSARPWLWTYDLVIICLGMTSACFLPACIPLLLFWLKPETKRWFGKH